MSYSYITVLNVDADNILKIESAMKVQYDLAHHVYLLCQELSQKSADASWPILRWKYRRQADKALKQTEALQNQFLDLQYQLAAEILLARRHLDLIKSFLLLDVDIPDDAVEAVYMLEKSLQGYREMLHDETLWDSDKVVEMKQDIDKITLKDIQNDLNNGLVTRVKMVPEIED